ncbi:MAG: hypothetical protein JWO46_1993 [Nocardioidaceae bacterium]|nr:hypothetical protein [Nocardioidaceae bacterium]
MTEPALPAARICSHGHMIVDASLKACPACGVTLPKPEIPVKTRSLAPPQPKVHARMAVPFLVGALILIAWGTLLSRAAEHGLAEVFGWLLIAAGLVVAVSGVVSDARHRRS